MSRRTWSWLTPWRVVGLLLLAWIAYMVWYFRSGRWWYFSEENPSLLDLPAFPVRWAEKAYNYVRSTLQPG